MLASSVSEPESQQQQQHQQRREAASVGRVCVVQVPNIPADNSCDAASLLSTALPLPFFHCALDADGVEQGPGFSQEFGRRQEPGNDARSDSVTSHGPQYPDRVMTAFAYLKEKRSLALCVLRGGKRDETLTRPWQAVPLLHAGSSCPMRVLQRCIRDHASGSAAPVDASTLSVRADHNHMHLDNVAKLDQGNLVADTVVRESSFDAEALSAECDRASLALPHALPTVWAATTVILRSRLSGAVLLTRRAATMRSFPHTWVMPGGHVDAGEQSLAAAAARELQEEVGVLLPGDDASLVPVALYESASPVVLDLGVPRHRHIVIYFAAEVDDAVPLDQLRLSPEEVDAVAWLRPAELRLAFSPNSSSDDLLTSIKGFVNVGSPLLPSWTWQDIPLRAFVQKPLPGGGFENERISTGTRVVLELLLNGEV